jgi:protein TonB
MRDLMCVFTAAVLLPAAAAQVQVPFPRYVNISPGVADTLLIHKEEPACQKDSDGVRITGTVVIAIAVDKHGNVNHARAISGPKLLRPLALSTVRKYRYKPFLLNGTPVEVHSTVSMSIKCVFHSGQA